MKDLLLFDEIINVCITMKKIREKRNIITYPIRRLYIWYIKIRLLNKIKEIEEIVFAKNYLTYDFITEFCEFYFKVNNSMKDRFIYLNIIKSNNKYYTINMDNGRNVINISGYKSNYGARENIYVSSEETIELLKNYKRKTEIYHKAFFNVLPIDLVASTKLSNLIFLYIRTYIKNNNF